MDPKIEIGDVVQVDPSHDDVFGACFLIVTELKVFGVMGYVTVPGKGSAFHRVPYDKVKWIGYAKWISYAEPQQR